MRRLLLALALLAPLTAQAFTVIGGGGGSTYTGTAPIVVSGTVVSCTAASGSVAGCLSAANWTTFNAKESALTFSAPLSRSVNTISIPDAGAAATGVVTSGTQTFGGAKTFNGAVSLAAGMTLTLGQAVAFDLSAHAKIYADGTNKNLIFVSDLDGADTTHPAYSFAPRTVLATGAIAARFWQGPGETVPLLDINYDGGMAMQGNLQTKFVFAANGYTSFSDMRLIGLPTTGTATAVIIGANNALLVSGGDKLVSVRNNISTGGGTEVANFDAEGNLQLGIGSTDASACAAGIRGKIRYTPRGAGVADLLQVCAKTSGDAYFWIDWGTPIL